MGAVTHPAELEWLEASGEDLYLHREITVDAGQEPIRMDVYLRRVLGDISRTRIQLAAEQGYIKINGQPRKPSFKIKGGDHITVLLPQPPRATELVPQNIPLDVVYEDEHLLVINKPPGMVVHPGVGNPYHTVVNAVLYHMGYREPIQESVEPVNNFPRPGLVHRLDKNTSGLMVIAKSELALTHLAGQFFYKTAGREYLAIVWGRLEPDTGTIRAPIGRSSRDRKIMEVKESEEEGKPAVTHYKVEKHLNYLTVVRCRLETGRTHQIRVHMKHIGHTVFNDPEYGGQMILKGPNSGPYKQFMKSCMALLPGQALHAERLHFSHPLTGEAMAFFAPPPPGFLEIIRRVEEYLLSSVR
ncbi:MAG: RluA family pseudouridine synthase [Flavobacteriales bacterium]|nr:RluA family pseudouridine synthase [Flavobacteriales bacterium]MCX7768839.1 RluA family pseudouridine synthase [Flavobacteriales bacterium]MDW8410509.1 RluA family pseudouridine synthase [Flavobacteriales bacterium]